MRAQHIAMQKITLTQGKVALVDDADYWWLLKFRWYYSASTGYARANLGANKKANMHQLLLPRVEGLMADHINRDKLDNRRVNLRLVTKSENNRNKMQHDNRSGFIGVVQHKTNGRWIAQASLNNRNYYIGSYGTPEEAAVARTDFLEKWRSDPASIPPKGELFRNNTSGFRGVYPQKLRSGKGLRWAAQVNVGSVDGRSKHRHLGMFATPKEAFDAIQRYRSAQSVSDG